MKETWIRELLDAGRRVSSEVAELAAHTAVLAARLVVWAGRTLLKLAAIPVVSLSGAMLACALVGWLYRLLDSGAAISFLAGLIGIAPPDVSSNVLSYGIATFGGAIILGALRDLKNEIPTVFDFFRVPSLEKLARTGATVFIATAGVLLSVLALSAVPSFSLKDGITALKETLHTEGTQLRASLSELSGGGQALIVPVYVSTPSSAKSDREPLLRLNFPYFPVGDDAVRGDGDTAIVKPVLQSLATSLRSCAQSEQIRINVVGFADSGRYTVKTDQQNLELANSRAMAVCEFLATQLGLNPAQATKECACPALADVSSEPVGEPSGSNGAARQVRTSCWKPTEIELMRHRRRFVDGGEGAYDSDQGQFNRRVDVEIYDLGGCTPAEAAVQLRGASLSAPDGSAAAPTVEG